tara:strand:- start:1234 stop:1449 length:216 start_codon:yes stop_codon:yes gene_type:complete
VNGHTVQEKGNEGMPKDACYQKVKRRYKVFPSAYASGAIAKCRKVGAANWGNKSKKKAKGGTYKYKTTSIY